MTTGRGRIAPVTGIILLFVIPGFAGCLKDADYQVAASAPVDGGGLTIVVAALDGIAGGTKAFYEIRRDGEVVYPLGGLLAGGGFFYIQNGKGEAFVTYDKFVVGNGNYEVVVQIGDDTRSTFVKVEKWVEYVYMYAYPRSGRIVVDLQLSTQTGGLPSDRIVAEGDLWVDLRYRGVDGNGPSERVRRYHESTSGEDTYTRLSYPRSHFDAGPGWYSFHATFHNHQAAGNNNVGDDPSMEETTPPRNWVCIDACA